jgi:excisionase family DNA binding protein
VARRLRVSRITVMRWVRAGELPAAKVGKAWRVGESELARWLRRRTTRSGGVAALGWTREESHATRRRLAAFEDDWNVPGMEAYDEL